MAKVEADLSLFMTPQAYANVKDEKKSRDTPKAGMSEFSRMFDEVRGMGGSAGAENLPVCEETLDFLMDEVRSAGDSLRDRPFPDEILRYKRSIRNFIGYVVKNGFDVIHEAGIPNYLRPNFKGAKGTPAAREVRMHAKIQVIDERLETLAAMLLSSQRQQIGIAARLEEITGLLIDLLQ
ncbi:MAG: YaaR family protein [Treponema sp.]|nr:YaaR family protein [Treponema sp.]